MRFPPLRLIVMPVLRRLPVSRGLLRFPLPGGVVVVPLLALLRLLVAGGVPAVPLLALGRCLLPVRLPAVPLQPAAPSNLLPVPSLPTVPFDRTAASPTSLNEDARSREIRLGKRPVDSVFDVPSDVAQPGTVLPSFGTSYSNPVCAIRRLLWRRLPCCSPAFAC